MFSKLSVSRLPLCSCTIRSTIIQTMNQKLSKEQVCQFNVISCPDLNNFTSAVFCQTTSKFGYFIKLTSIMLPRIKLDRKKRIKQ